MNKNHSEGIEKCCQKCTCSRKNCSLICHNSLCACHSISSGQRILEEFDKKFCHEDFCDVVRYKNAENKKCTCEHEYLKAFISASLRTHTREVLEDLKIGLQKKQEIENIPIKYTDYMSGERVAAYAQGIEAVKKLLTEEIDRLK